MVPVLCSSDCSVLKPVSLDDMTGIQQNIIESKEKQCIFNLRAEIEIQKYEWIEMNLMNEWIEMNLKWIERKHA